MIGDCIPDLCTLTRGMADEISLHERGGETEALAACAPMIAGYAVTLTAVLVVQVRIRNVFGTVYVDPANDVARTFAEISGHKTLTQATLRGIRALGYTVEVLAGDQPGLPEGW